MIVIGQDFRLTLDTEIDITGATTANIRYVKPSGAEVSVAGTIIDITKVYFDVTPAINDTEGKWKFRADIVLGGLQYFSKPAFLNIRNSWYPWTNP